MKKAECALSPPIFENFKKRAARERIEAAQFANAALDSKTAAHPRQHRNGAGRRANRARRQTRVVAGRRRHDPAAIEKRLAETGLEEIDATGKPFDPALHEAVSQQETSEIPEGHVFQQIRKGYKLRDRLLRPATVIVAKKPAAN
jgi:molecular chaperone GrpE